MTRPVPVFRPVFSRLQRGAAIVTALLVGLLAAVTVKYGLRPLWMRWLDSADGQFAIQDKQAN